MTEPVDQYVEQLETIRRRLLAFPEGHLGLQIAAMARMSDLIRLGRFADIQRIAGYTEQSVTERTER